MTTKKEVAEIIVGVEGLDEYKIAIMLKRVIPQLVGQRYIKIVLNLDESDCRIIAMEESVKGYIESFNNHNQK